MNRPELSDPQAARMWDDYVARIDCMLRQAGDAAGELGEDLRSHLADSYAAEGDAGAEAQRLARAIAKLGEPETYLRPLVAEALLRAGTRSYNPFSLARGLYHSLWAGSRFALSAALFSLGYLLLAILALMVLLRPLWASHVGLFRSAEGQISFGILSETAGAQDLLGPWTEPVTLLAVAVLYLLLTTLLRRLRP